MDRLAVHRRSNKHGGRVSALNARVPGVEGEEHIGESVAVNILQGHLSCSRFRPSSPKAYCSGIDSGRIKGGRGQNRHEHLARAPGIDARWVDTGLDVNHHGLHRRLEFNRSDVAGTDAWLPQLIGGRARRVVARIDGLARGQ